VTHDPAQRAMTQAAAVTPQATPEDTRRHQPAIALAGVIAVFVVLGVFIAVKTPAFESADEPGHVENIETLVSGHWYSVTPHCKVTVLTVFDCFNGTEAHQAPLYYLILAGWQRVAGQPVEPPYVALDHFSGHALLGLQGEMFTHHSEADLRYLLWLRLPNVLFGALTVLLTFFAIRLITTDEWTPVVAASLVAFLPRFVFLSSFVTNDNLVDLTGALLVFFALRYTIGPSRWRMAAVGGSVGLLVVTKLSALPIALVIFGLAWMVTGWRRRAELVAVGFGSALVFCGWYLIQNTVRYGDPLARTASARYLSLVDGLGTAFGQPYRVTDPLGLVFGHVPRHIVETFWYQSGWGQFDWSLAVDLVITAAFALALLGLIHRRIARTTLATLAMVSLLSLLCVWVVAFQTATYQARYVFVGLAAICGLAALGLERWRVPVRFVLPMAGLIGTLVAIQQDVLSVHWN
jgi:dolichyl-phosphate-mannose-protein mannosyltransferase